MLIGTFAGGLVSFDGKSFREITAGAERRRIKRINSIAQNGAQLLAGTFDDGLWLREGNVWRHSTTAEGLPSNRIVGFAARGDDLFVATDFGLARARVEDLKPQRAGQNQKLFESVALLPSLSGVAEFGGDIVACRDDGALFALTNDAKNRFALNEIESSRAQSQANSRAQTNSQFIPTNDELLLVGSRGIESVQLTTSTRNADARNAASTNRSAPRVALASFAFADEARTPASNLISALAVDGENRLWAGNFRSGADVFDSSRRKTTHLESDSLRETNALVFDRTTHAVYAATAQGLWRFDRAASFANAKQLTTSDGLLSDSVMQVSIGFQAKESQSTNAATPVVYCATSRGVSFTEGAEGKQWRALTTVQGLPSASVYATLREKSGRIFVGTLGGLGKIENNRVARVFRDDNSKLTHNWVTSLAEANGRIFVGTYGGGVFELNGAGELQALKETKGQTVNPNAMWADLSRLYVGTPDGTLVLDFSTQRWTHLKEEVPSPVVLSVTADERAAYFSINEKVK